MKIIKFQTDSCVACKFLESILDKIQSTYPEIEIERVDALDESSKNLVDRYHVDVVPTIVIMCDNGEEKVLRSLQACSDLSAIIDNIMKISG